MNKQYDNVNNPQHYTSGKYEVIDIIADQLGEEGLRGFCLGNALKYICRAGKKDPEKEVEDLKKAIWYLNHYVQEHSNQVDDKKNTFDKNFFMRKRYEFLTGNQLFLDAAQSKNLQNWIESCPSDMWILSSTAYQEYPVIIQHPWPTEPINLVNAVLKILFNNNFDFYQMELSINSGEKLEDMFAVFTCPTSKWTLCPIDDCIIHTNLIKEENK